MLSRIGRAINRDKYLYLLVSPVVAYYIIFHYVPMYGVLIAFENFKPLKGIIGSPWAGFKHFQEYFDSVYFWRLIRNTILLHIYSLLWGFPAPILFALLLNELKDRFFKRFVQTVSYLPHFISTAVVVGMIVNFISLRDGIINHLLEALGLQKINFLAEPGWFRTIYVSSGVWQGFGWGSIIYLAALAGINQEMYEAAEIDGANRWQKMGRITLPALVPTIVILLILNLGHMLGIGLEKVLLLQNELTYDTSDVIATYVYRKGILASDYSYGAAVGLFNNVVNLVLLVVFNRLARKLTDTSLW